MNVKRIGILLADMGKLNVPALKYLVLHMNTLQQTFEYEFLPSNNDDEFLRKLSQQAKAVREEIEAGVRPFLKRYKTFLKQEIMGYYIKDTAIPNDFILITLACFEDRYYSTHESNLSILALGNWKRTMAPPSIIEFILALIVRESISIVCPFLANSVHLGTRGCICDFTAYLSDVRIKVLSGFVCQYCSTTLETEGLQTLPKELAYILSKEWLGNPNDSKSPAGIVGKLGFNLFITKGLEPSFRENLSKIFLQEVTKQLLITLIFILQSILIAFLLIRLGLNGH